MSYGACSSQQTTIDASSEYSTSRLSRPEPVPAVGSSRHSRQRAHPKRTPVSALSSNDPSSTSNNRRLYSAPQERVLQVENAPWKARHGAYQNGTLNQDCTQPQTHFRAITLRTNKMEEILLRRRKRKAWASADVSMKPALDRLQDLEKQLQYATQEQSKLAQAALRQWEQAGRL
jgi:hypothetical protein